MIKYFDQAKLMLTVLPIVGQEEAFALKGCTALIFFILRCPGYQFCNRVGERLF